MTPVETVLSFLDAINSDDADKVAGWITDNRISRVVCGGLIREWRVYTDHKPVYDILAKSARPAAK